MMTLVSEAIPALPNRSADRAITPLKHAFIMIPGSPRWRNLIAANADIALNGEISAANAVLFLN
jgi:hypothetical protein